jgi:O-antigen ligase
LLRLRSLRLAAGIGVLAILLPVVAWFLFPTLQNRIRYIRYDRGYFEKAHYWPGGNDALRVISWKAGLALWQSSPLTGTGFGDLRRELNGWYRQHYPEMPEQEHLLPASEWILYAAGAGITGLLGFAAALMLPLFSRVRPRGPWWALNAAAGFTLLADIGLEVQYGVFIHAFVLLAGREWLNAQNNTSLQPHDSVFHRDRLPQ